QYYVRPEEQLGQLEALGFRDIEIYLMDGRKLEDRKELSRVDAMWFYYLCRI
ncbi:MAG: class I SAM-dependent methyltransferase, partial [Elusimicrobia bacterium]|nr:class I SAM-dependent methyltransferase [Elusimicrobiota bacterium]